MSQHGARGHRWLAQAAQDAAIRMRALAERLEEGYTITPHDVRREALRLERVVEQSRTVAPEDEG